MQKIIINLKPFSTRKRFHINSSYHLTILYSFRNLCGGIKIVKTVDINLLTSIDSS
ncbi:hypothetical protein E2C01_028755 [Portunus trituberculatus]|uniref:Uncharacterized protein n=1 Tax=Portunus trituberculatus TaxID=210409 RepID=A0A5B7EQV5_PORTR|nr:hypothetical protein [Portunus trituberculatus]